MKNARMFPAQSEVDQVKQDLFPLSDILWWARGDHGLKHIGKVRCEMQSLVYNSTAEWRMVWGRLWMDGWMDGSPLSTEYGQ